MRSLAVESGPKTGNSIIVFHMHMSIVNIYDLDIKVERDTL
jgi:hypothetical protein